MTEKKLQPPLIKKKKDSFKIMFRAISLGERGKLQKQTLKLF